MQWDFEKGLLAAMAALILAGVGVIFWQRSVAADLSTRLPTSERQLTRIGRRAGEIEQLKEAIKQDQIARGSKPFEYLETQMTASRIGRKFQIMTRPEQKFTDYVDTVYELTPRDGGIDFDRQAIATFLLYIEGNTTLMKVTRVRLDLSTRGGAGSDAWKPRFEITERRATAGAGVTTS